MIWLCQYLCPERHTIVAVAYDPGPGAQAEEIEAFILAELPRQQINPWCGLCGRKDLRFEHGRTPYTSMAEAMPFLRAEARKNAVARALFGGRY